MPILIACFTRHQKLREILRPLEGLPNPIYVVLDSPRDDSDRRKVAEVCKVLQTSNLDIKDMLTFKVNQGTNSVALGVDWVLRENDSVIVIEEDIFVSSQFIPFAENMLKKYKSDFRVWSITAMNLVPCEQLTRPRDSYRFSCYFYAWGWATWRDRWEQMIPLEQWDINSLRTPKTVRNTLAIEHWKSRMREVRSGRAPGLWDYRWIYTYWEKRWLTVVPNKNLALNIGFDIDATHTKQEPVRIAKQIEILDLSDELVCVVRQDIRADSWSARFVHNTYWLTIVKTKIKFFFSNWSFEK